MGSRPDMYNWPPVHTSWGNKRMGSRPDIDYQLPIYISWGKKTNGLQATYLWPDSWLHFKICVDIRNNNRNRADNRTLDIFWQEQRGARPCWKIKRSYISHPWGKADTAYVQEDFTGSKRQRMRVSLGLLPSASVMKSILTEVCACAQWTVLRQGSQGIKMGRLATKKIKNRKTAPL